MTSTATAAADDDDDDDDDDDGDDDDDDDDADDDDDDDGGGGGSGSDEDEEATNSTYLCRHPTFEKSLPRIRERRCHRRQERLRHAGEIREVVQNGVRWLDQHVEEGHPIGGEQRAARELEALGGSDHLAVECKEFA